MKQEICVQSIMKSRQHKNGPKRGSLWCCRPGFWLKTVEAAEDRRFCSVSVPRGRVQCHSQIFGGVSRVGSAMTGYIGSAIQVSSLPVTPNGVLKFPLTLAHSLYSSHCHTGFLQTERETEQRQTSSLSCTFSSQGTARSEGIMNSHHTRTPLFHLPKWRLMLPWRSDSLKHINKKC